MPSLTQGDIKSEKFTEVKESKKEKLPYVKISFSSKGIGHIALGTCWEDEKGKIVKGKGIYASFWPKISERDSKRGCVAITDEKHKMLAKRDHLHLNKNDDKLAFQTPPDQEIKLYGLDIEKIHERFLEFKTSGYQLVMIPISEIVSRETIKSNTILMQKNHEDTITVYWLDDDELFTKNIHPDLLKSSSEKTRKTSHLNNNELIDKIITICDIPRKFTWTLAGSMVILDKIIDKNKKNCAGLCLCLLEAGGLFSQLNYNKSGLALSLTPNSRWFLYGGLIAAGITVLVGGAVGGMLTIEMGGGAIAGTLLGAWGGWVLVTYLFNVFCNQIYKPSEVLNIVKKLKRMENILSSTDLDYIKGKINQEILRLKSIRFLKFFDDTDAKNKALLLGAALFRAERDRVSKNLITVQDFLFYSYDGMPSILFEICQKRDTFEESITGLFNILHPTDSFINLMELNQELSSVSTRKTASSSSSSSSYSPRFITSSSSQEMLRDDDVFSTENIPSSRSIFG